MGLSSQSMNLDYIRTFVVLGQSRSMTEASLKLGVNISNISRHIKELERQLNTKLVISGLKNKDLQLTDSGKYFFEKYEKIYNEILLTEKTFMQTEQLDNCKITIGISNDLEENVLKPRLIEFSKLYPNITLKILNEDTDKLTDKLLQYAIDVIIDKKTPVSKMKYPVITTQELYKSNYCYVYNKKYFNDISDIEKVPFILPVSKTSERLLIDEYFSNMGIKPKIKYEVSNIDRMLSYVKSGCGVGIILKDAISDTDNLGILDINIETNISLSYIEDKLTPSTKEFIKLFNIKI